MALRSKIISSADEKKFVHSPKVFPPQYETHSTAFQNPKIGTQPSAKARQMLKSFGFCPKNGFGRPFFPPFRPLQNAISLKKPNKNQASEMLKSVVLLT